MVAYGKAIRLTIPNLRWNEASAFDLRAWVMSPPAIIYQLDVPIAINYGAKTYDVHSFYARSSVWRVGSPVFLA